MLDLTGREAHDDALEPEPAEQPGEHVARVALGRAQERALLAAAERKLAEAAQADPELLRAAERNTRDMLTGLLQGLGFERVIVRFAPRQV